MKNIVEFLKINNYKYILEGNKLDVYIEKSFILKILIDREAGTYQISDTFMSLNFLTGIMKLSLKKVLVLHTVILILLFFGMQYLRYSEMQYDFDYVILVYLGILFSWFFYYYIKMEIFKITLQNLLYHEKH